MARMKWTVVGFAAVGGAVATALLAYDYLILVSPSGINRADLFDMWLFLALCPPSIALMGMEHAHGLLLWFSLFFIVGMNAGIYGICGVIWNGIRYLGTSD